MGRKLAALLVLSAVPLALLVALELRIPAGGSFEYRSLGWIRETLKWDDQSRRFLVSTFLDGGVSEILLSGSAVPSESPFLYDPAVAGNGSLGIALDHPRNRLLVVYADVLGNRYSALGAYDLSSRRRLFLSLLSSGEPLSLADDVAVDSDGNAYVTDAKGNRIWKVGVNGDVLSTIRSPLFTANGSLRNLVGLNGIVFHPDGYLLVIHTFGGILLRVELATEEVSAVEVTAGSLMLGDGLALVSPTKLAVAAGVPSGRMVESVDGWKTAKVTGVFYGPVHRIAASATVKDGRVFLQHLLGGRSHVISEAVF